MKNFRKVLALVLVVATLFSFVAMTASAKEYTDGDKVSYTEAVDVLSAIGILNGYQRWFLQTHQHHQAFRDGEDDRCSLPTLATTLATCTPLLASSPT